MPELFRFAWHELLSPLAPPKPHPETAQALYDRGKDVHRRVEAIIGEARLVDQERVYREPDLPFEIAYHPDILRQEVSPEGYVQTFVYEIKPLIWFLKNRLYCEAQASGYAHFTGAADACFILYWTNSRNFEELGLSVYPLRRMPWNELRQVALRAYHAMIKA